MAVLVLVPSEELLRKGSGILNRAKAFRETGPVFQSPEVTFRIRVIVGDVRAAVGFDDPQIRHQKGIGFGCHGRTPIRVNSQLARLKFLLSAGIPNECCGQFRAFPIRDHPAHDIAAEDI